MTDVKDPAHKKRPGIPRAPAGMETDPETGDILLNDKSKGLKPVKAELVRYRVAFPNMETRPYSIRPHFAHDWYRSMKKSAIREGGEMLIDDKRATFLTVGFRTPRAAYEFIKTLCVVHYVPNGDVRMYVEKQARNEFESLQHVHNQVIKDKSNISPQQVVERAVQVWDSPVIQKWLRATGLEELRKFPNYTLDTVVQNPELLQDLHAAVLEAEKNVREKNQSMPQITPNKGPGKLMFDPSKYIKRAGTQPIYKRISSTVKEASQESLYEGDTVLVSVEGELVEGKVKTTSPTTAMVTVDGEFMHVPKSSLTKVTVVRVPMERFPRQSLAVGHRARLTNGEYVRVTSVTGYDGHTKVSTLTGSEVRWVPNDSLEVIARVAKFPDQDQGEWLDKVSVAAVSPGDRVRFKRSSPGIDRTKSWDVINVDGDEIWVERGGEKHKVSIHDVDPS